STHRHASTAAVAAVEVVEVVEVVEAVVAAAAVAVVVAVVSRLSQRNSEIPPQVRMARLNRFIFNRANVLLKSEAEPPNNHLKTPKSK
ncbi:MAG: hypothetical protein WA821_22615, partial [Anaerolineales bacterium]